MKAGPADYGSSAQHPGAASHPQRAQCVRRPQHVVWTRNMHHVKIGWEAPRAALNPMTRAAAGTESPPAMSPAVRRGPC